MPFGFGGAPDWSEEDIAALVAAYNGTPNSEVVSKDPYMSMLGYLWWPEAKTLRERVFVRLVEGVRENYLYFKHSGASFTVYPQQPTFHAFLKVCATTYTTKEALSSIPFVKVMNSYANDELPTWLQDLGYILAEETTQAYTAKYFPGLPSVTVDDEHVKVVMAAMQRELFREGDGGSRGHAVQLAELPFERQRALAERRRHWFGVFGIYPETWTTGNFSLWNVQDIPMPALRRPVAY